MESQSNDKSGFSPVRETISGQQRPALARATVRSVVSQPCEDCRAQTAFHYWQQETLTPSFNVEIDFTSLVKILAGKRAVIELVTATIQVPMGEWARLRMSTSLGEAPSNLDLTLTPQNAPGKPSLLLATHSLRVYSDHDVFFNVNRDNADTSGNAFICISGYLVDA